jgi:hypothetical protein
LEKGVKVQFLKNWPIVVYNYDKLADLNTFSHKFEIFLTHIDCRGGKKHFWINCILYCGPK